MSDSHGAHTHAHGMEHEGHVEGQPHASVKFYWMIGLILAVITGIEVAVFYIEALSSLLVPILIVLSVAKFVLVVQFFMHLKYDHAIFGRVFWAPLFLAVLVVVGLVLLFHVLPKYGKFI